LLGARNRADMIGGFLVVFKRFGHFPWYKHHMTIFITAYLSDFYIVVKEKRKKKNSVAGANVLVS